MPFCFFARRAAASESASICEARGKGWRGQHQALRERHETGRVRAGADARRRRAREARPWRTAATRARAARSAPPWRPISRGGAHLPGSEKKSLPPSATCDHQSVFPTRPVRWGKEKDNPKSEVSSFETHPPSQSMSIVSPAPSCAEFQFTFHSICGIKGSTSPPFLFRLLKYTRGDRGRVPGSEGTGMGYYGQALRTPSLTPRPRDPGTMLNIVPGWNLE